MPPRLLVVEDEADMVELYTLTFRGIAGYTWRFARTVAEARRQLPVVKPDVLLLDWNLPDADGLELLLELRASPEWRGLPVFMVSGRTAPEDCAEALNSGADDFLEKPVHRDVLLARLAKVARASRHPVNESRPLLLDGLYYDPSAAALAVDGKPVHLCPKELHLLEAFLARPNVVHSLDHLWEEVWSGGSRHREHVFQATLSRLRRALGAWSERIECVKGVGYVLRAQPSRR